MPLKTLQKITGARRPQDVPELLEDLRGAIEVDGSLEIEPDREYVREDGNVGVAWDWRERPTIRIRPGFSTIRRQVRFADWREENGLISTAGEREIRETQEEHSAQLARIERTLGDIAWGVYRITGDPTMANRIVEELISSSASDD